MNDYVINTPSDFNLKETLECGQCFHFNMLDENEYVLTAYGQLLHIRQDDSNLVFYDTDEKIYDTLWRKYFDIDRDYGKIKEELLAKDDKQSYSDTEKLLVSSAADFIGRQMGA